MAETTYSYISSTDFPEGGLNSNNLKKEIENFLALRLEIDSNYNNLFNANVYLCQPNILTGMNKLRPNRTKYYPNTNHI